MPGIMNAVASLRGALTPPATFATWDPATHNADMTLSGSNLIVTRGAGSSGSAWRTVRATIGKSTGKWYWELLIGTDPNVSSSYILGTADSGLSQTNYLGVASVQIGYQSRNPAAPLIYINGGAPIGGSISFTTGDVIGVALDADAGNMRLYKNNTLIADWGATVTTLFPALAFLVNGDTVTANFGASAMVYSPPAGYNTGLYA